MKKFRIMLALFVLSLACSFLLTACDGDSQVTNLENTSNSVVENSTAIDEMFEMELVGQSSTPATGDEILGDPNRFYIYREVKTDVLYICFEEYRKGGLTVMLDPETGLPLTYSRYLQDYN